MIAPSSTRELNARSVLEARYLRRTESGALETGEELLARVAGALAEAEPVESRARWAARFSDLMLSGDFLPSSPILFNAGHPRGALSACYVVPLEDDLDSITGSIAAAAKIHQAGGGTGFSLSALRPQGDDVRGTPGVAPGPLPWLEILSLTTATLRQAERRSGANLASLSVYHPDVREFLRWKADGRCPNFNISVLVDEEFMRRAEAGTDYATVNPRTGEAGATLNAAEVLAEIAQSAWATGDPGLLFAHRLNAARTNPTPALGPIETTNPCGEAPLLPWEACVLGSLDLSRFAAGGAVAYGRLADAAAVAVRLLDNAIDVSWYPLPQIEQRHRDGNRKIGLGVMGWADLLVRLGIPYDCDAAVALAGHVMRCISDAADAASEQLAAERGTFANWPDSVYGPQGANRPLRNATRTAIAPTGTLSLIAGCSPSIEPLFALSSSRNVLDGHVLREVNAEFRDAVESRGLWSDAIANAVACGGSCRGIDTLPEDLRAVFGVAHDIAPEWHIAHQAAFQAHVDNAVSKTVNLPATATPDDVLAAYRLAFSRDCTGITVYRDGSKTTQVVDFGEGGCVECAL